MSTTTFFRFGIKTAVGVLVTGVLTAPTFAENKALTSVAVTVGDPGNPFFVEIAHGAEAKAKEINPNVKFTALSCNYDLNNQTNQITLLSVAMNAITKSKP